MKLDMSKFKKISADKQHTIMQHDDGHSIKIAHSRLSPAMRKQLEKLPVHAAEGLEIEELDKPIPKNPIEFEHIAGTSKDEPKRTIASVGKKLEIEAIADDDQPKYAKGQEVDQPLMMADGGQVDKGPRIDPKAAKEIQTGATKSGWQPEQWKKNLKEGLGLASGGEPKTRMAEGGEVAQDSSSVSDQKPITINIGTPQAPQPQLPGQMLPPVPQMASQQAAPNEIPESVLNQAASNMFMMPKDQQALKSGAPQASAPVENPEMKNAIPTSQEEQSTGIAPQAPQVKAPNFMHAYEQQQQATTGIGNAQQQLATAQEQQFKTQASAMNKINQDYTSHIKELELERKSLQDDIKNTHIDPTRYLGNMDTGKKIQTAISLFLGGLGQGPNTALEFLNKQIDRDIESQRATLGKKESLLNANYRQMGNIKDAMAMTKLMMMDTSMAQMNAVAAKSNSQQAVLRSQQMNAQAEAQMAPAMQQLAMNRMLMQAGTSGGVPSQEMLGMLRVIKPEQAKELESRLIPGVGMATVPVPDKVRDEVFKRSNLVKATDHLMKWTKQHGGSLDPKVRAEGEALAAELQQVYRQGVGASTSEGEQKVIENIINSNPGEILAQITTSPKLKALKESMTSSLNTLKKQYGLPEGTPQTDMTPQQKSFAQWAQSNISSKDPSVRQKAQLVLKKLGLTE